MQINDAVVAVKEETFNTITIYGFGTIVGIEGDNFIIRLDTENIIYSNQCCNIVKVNYWCEYVDERHANVVRCEL